LLNARSPRAASPSAAHANAADKQRHNAVKNLNITALHLKGQKKKTPSSSYDEKGASLNASD
jgi:hypothetical protein